MENQIDMLIKKLQYKKNQLLMEKEKSLKLIEEIDKKIESLIEVKNNRQGQIRFLTKCMKASEESLEVARSFEGRSTTVFNMFSSNSGLYSSYLEGEIEKYQKEMSDHKDDLIITNCLLDELNIIRSSKIKENEKIDLEVCELDNQLDNLFSELLQDNNMKLVKKMEG